MPVTKHPDRFRERKDSTKRELDTLNQIEEYISKSIGSNVEKFRNFAKYAPRQTLTRFISRYEIFKRVLSVQGSVIDCGVLFGGSLMTFAQLSAILEPVNHQREVVGFDTFEGFLELATADRRGTSEKLRKGGFAIDSYDDILKAVTLFDSNRTIGHVPKVKLVRGPAEETIPRYLEENPHTVVSLLHLDFDTYEPTKAALESFLPRMPKGAIIIFDELNARNWPGETAAVMEVVGVSNLRIERFPFDTYISFATIE